MSWAPDLTGHTTRQADHALPSGIIQRADEAIEALGQVGVALTTMLNGRPKGIRVAVDGHAGRVRIHYPDDSEEMLSGHERALDFSQALGTRDALRDACAPLRTPLPHARFEIRPRVDVRWKEDDRAFGGGVHRWALSFVWFDRAVLADLLDEENADLLDDPDAETRRHPTTQVCQPGLDMLGPLAAVLHARESIHLPAAPGRTWSLRARFGSTTRVRDARVIAPDAWSAMAILAQHHALAAVTDRAETTRALTVLRVAPDCNAQDPHQKAGTARGALVPAGWAARLRAHLAQTTWLTDEMEIDDSAPLEIHGA